MGILYFISEEEVRRLLRALHAFCGPGSVLAYSFLHVPEGPAAQAMLDIMRRGQELARITPHARTPEQMAELVKPWRVRAQKPAEEWLEVPDMLGASDHDIKVVGALADYWTTGNATRPRREARWAETQEPCPGLGLVSSFAGGSSCANMAA